MTDRDNKTSVSEKPRQTTREDQCVFKIEKAVKILIGFAQYLFRLLSSIITRSILIPVLLVIAFAGFDICAKNKEVRPIFSLLDELDYYDATGWQNNLETIISYKKIPDDIRRYFVRFKNWQENQLKAKDNKNILKKTNKEITYFIDFLDKLHPYLRKEEGLNDRDATYYCSVIPYYCIWHSARESKGNGGIYKQYIDRFINCMDQFDSKAKKKMINIICLYIRSQVENTNQGFFDNMFNARKYEQECERAKRYIDDYIKKLEDTTGPMDYMNHKSWLKESKETLKYRIDHPHLGRTQSLKPLDFMTY